ncbi:hypothetical protein L9F63_017812, partial [Diploptera punctata]
SVYDHIYRGKFNFFSTTFFRSSGDTSAIFRLSRCLYSMKCCIIYRINNFVRRSNYPWLCMHQETQRFYYFFVTWMSNVLFVFVVCETSDMEVVEEMVIFGHNLGCHVPWTYGSQ